MTRTGTAEATRPESVRNEGNGARCDMEKTQAAKTITANKVMSDSRNGNELGWVVSVIDISSLIEEGQGGMGWE